MQIIVLSVDLEEEEEAENMSILTIAEKSDQTIKRSRTAVRASSSKTQPLTETHPKTKKSISKKTSQLVSYLLMK